MYMLLKNDIIRDGWVLLLLTSLFFMMHVLLIVQDIVFSLSVVRGL